MKNKDIILVVVILALIGVMLFALRSLNQGVTQGKEILVYCGNSMMPAVEEIAKEYEKRYNEKVTFNTGGSETLLPAIILSGKGDIFVCHDPFAERLTVKGLMEKYETVGCLYPVVIVPKGNPLNIHSLEDLARPGVRVGMTDPRFSTAGEILHELFKKKGLEDAISKNIVMESKTHYDIANALALGHIDVCIVWNFIAALYNNDVDVVTGASPKVTKIREQLKNYGFDLVLVPEGLPETRVTVCLLKCTQKYKEADNFFNLCVSEFGRKTFIKHGYTKPKL
ncbi:MAG: substrate-binding domain-containing protein [Candidatus Omnitrophota bacterium]